MDILTTFPERFGAEVKRKRIEKQITQKELTFLLKEQGLNATQGYISLLEAGQRCDPSVKLVICLSVLLGISLDNIVEANTSFNS